MVKLPVDNTRERALSLQPFRLHPVSVHFHAVMLGGQVNVFHVGPVPGYAAVQAHLFQRDPFLVISQDHRETGRAAFQRFHLHDHRHFRNAVPDGLLQFLFRHRCSSCQFHRKLIGEVLSVTISASYCPDSSSAAGSSSITVIIITTTVSVPLRVASRPPYSSIFPSE